MLSNRMVENAGTAPRIAVLIPCYNEEMAIANVVGGFRSALPEATVYVFDNNSSDRTPAVARAAGAVVRRETLQGKGYVVRRMFADIEADIYVLVDGDGTYQADAVRAMVSLLTTERLEMVTGVRIAQEQGAYRRGHRLGNQVLTGLVRTIFGRGNSDMLSGYRVFSRRFVKTFPAVSTGFEIETELTVHALEMRLPIGEFPTVYKERPAGSASKLSTYRDGLRILRMIIQLLKEQRPLQFFSLCALVLFVAGASLGVPVVLEFVHTHLVPRLPTAVLATGFVLLSFLSLSAGLILDSVARGRMETKRLAYLSMPAGDHVFAAGEAAADERDLGWKRAGPEAVRTSA